MADKFMGQSGKYETHSTKIFSAIPSGMEDDCIIIHIGIGIGIGVRIGIGIGIGIWCLVLAFTSVSTSNIYLTRYQQK